MNGKFMLFVDQYGNRWYSCTIKDLRDQIGGGAVHKMYRDKKSGEAVHVGYVIGRLWLEMYKPVEIPA